MQVTLPAHILVEAIQRVQIAISTRSTLPILAHILLKYDHGICSLSATNLEIGIRTYLPEELVQVLLTPEECARPKKNDEEKRKVWGEEVQYGFTFDPKELYPQLKKTVKTTKGVKSSPLLCLVFSDKKLQYVYANQRGTLETMETNEFPSIPIPTDYSTLRPDNTFSFDLQELRHICTNTLFAAADDDSRPTLTGLCIRRSEEEIGKKRKRGEKVPTRAVMTFSAANAFRLANFTFPLENYHFEEVPQPDILIPAHTMQELFMKSEAPVFPKKGRVTCIIIQNRSQALFYEEKTRTIAVSRLIDGQFPDSKSIISSATRETTLFLTLSVEALLQALDAVKQNAKDSENRTHIALRQRPSGITAVVLFAHSNEKSSYSNITQGAAITGKQEYTGSYIIDWIAFNDILTAYKKSGISQIRMHITGRRKPLVFTPDAQEGMLEPLLSIVMPMSTENNAYASFSEEALQEYLRNIPCIAQEEAELLAFEEKYGWFPGTMVDTPLFSDLPV